MKEIQMRRHVVRKKEGEKTKVQRSFLICQLAQECIESIATRKELAHVIRVRRKYTVVQIVWGGTCMRHRDRTETERETKIRIKRRGTIACSQCMA